MFEGKKTYLAALTAIMGSFIAWQAGQIDLTTFLETSFVALMLATARQALETARQFLSGYRTYLVAGAGLLGAVISFASGQIEAEQFLRLIWEAAAAVFLRQGIAKANPK